MKLRFFLILLSWLIFYKAHGGDRSKKASFEIEFFSKNLELIRPLINVDKEPILDFSNSVIDIKLLREIFKKLKNLNSLTSLFLDNCDFELKVLQLIAEALKKNTFLMELSFKSNGVNELEVIEISNLLKCENKTLKKLWLSSNCIQDRGAEIIAEALQLNDSLVELHLDNNFIRIQGLESFRKLLKKNSYLQVLNLSNNAISDQEISISVWKKWAKISNNRKLIRLDLSNNQITENGVIQLEEILDSPILFASQFYEKRVKEIQEEAGNMEEIWGYSSQIGDRSALKIAEVLKNYKVLKSLNLARNQIGEIGIREIVKSLNESCALQLIFLNFSYNPIGEAGIKAIVEILKVSPLQSLCLDGNNIGNAGVEAIAAVLETNQTLTSLFLKKNKIGDSGIQTMMRAFQKNGALKLSFLDLSDNQFGNIGVKSVAALLEVNDTLISLNMSHNRIGNLGMMAIKKAFQKNGDLKLSIFDLSYNEIRDFDEEAVKKELQAHDTLIYLDMRGNAE